jgi:multicomponent K+:H+ antiporter subunit C
MTLLLSLGIGVLVGCGLWLLLRARTFDVVLGLTLLGYGVNLFIFAMGRPRPGAAPFVDAARAATLASHADPLPQALVLTAIVIGFAMTALLLAIALRSHAETGSDHVDGEEPHA